jgi:hypothetical protein
MMVDRLLMLYQRIIGMIFVSVKKVLKILAGIGAVILFQCSDPVSIPTYYKENFVIGGITWAFRNTPSDFNSSFSLCFDLNIKYSGVNLNYTQIEFVALKNRTITWTLNKESNLINDSLKILGYSNYFCYSTTYSSSASVLPVDSFKVQIGFKNGEVIERSFDASIPGCQNTSGYSHVYTQDYTGTPRLIYYKALARPKGIEVFKNGDTMVVSFTINDTSAYNGSVDFFDSGNVSVLNSTKLFRNYKSKEITAYINNGAGLRNSGELNTVKLPVSALDLKAGKSISDVLYARIIVTDGSQFSNESSATYRESYSFLSISPKMLVNSK